MPRAIWSGAISFGLVTSLNYCKTISNWGCWVSLRLWERD